VRLILEDETFDKLFGRSDANQYDARWSLLCSSISLYLSQHSGLPVDFQVQRTTEANTTYPGQRRHALGIFLETPR
jgi:hypothetical protein